MRNKKIHKSRKSILSTPPTNINNKFTSNSDVIAEAIIEKIISLSISASIKNRVEKEIPAKCFNYLKDFFSEKLKLEFLPHDSDDIQNNKNPNEISIHSDKFIPLNTSKDIEEKNKLKGYIMNQSQNLNDNDSLFNLEQIYFNNNLYGENNWDIINEPKSNRYDSYACTMVKFIEIEKDEIPSPKTKKNNKNNKGMKVNDLEEVKEEESLSKSNINNKKDNEQDKEKEKEKEKDIENNKNKEENKKNEFNKRIHNQTIKKINIFSQNNTIKKKRNDIDINQFPCKDIEDDNRYIETNDGIDYNKLRKELLEKEEAKLKEETQKAKKRNKTVNINEIRGENTLNRQYYGKNITIDPNGEIVQIKAIKLNNLKQEFKYAKTILKNIRLPKKIIKKDNKDKENKENKDNKDNTNSPKEEKIIKKEDENIENDKNNEINNLIDQLNPLTKRMSDKKILPKISQKKLNLEIKIDNKETKKRREPVFPSGSNFDLINMEIGVSIKEDEKFKTGGRDFFKKFNKYSKDIYNEKLKESLTANSFLNTKTQIFNEEMNRFKTESNFEHTYGGFNTTVNQDKDNSKYLMTSTNNFGNYNYISNISNLINSNNNNNNMTKTVTNGMNKSNILNPSIRLGNISSLVGSMDRLNLITEREEKFGKPNNNLFKIGKKNKIKALFLNTKYKEMDEFTKEILKSKDPSNRGEFKSHGKSTFIPSKNPEKPSILEITRELGYNKRPIRNRSKITSSLANPALQTVDFFKQ